MNTFAVDQPKCTAAESATGPIEHVRSQENSAGLRQGGNALAQRQPTAVAEIRLGDVHGLQGCQARELLQHVQPFASRNGKRQCRLHLLEQVQIVGRNRFFVKTGPVFFQSPAHRYGRLAREPPVNFDENLHVGADCLADRRHARFGHLHFVLRQLLPRHAEGIELQRTVAARDDLARTFGILGRRPRIAVPAVGVSRQPLPRRPPSNW